MPRIAEGKAEVLLCTKNVFFPFGIFSGDYSAGLDSFQLIFYLLSCCFFEHSAELGLGHEAAIFVSFGEESELLGPQVLRREE